ncbi:MAG: hypothetical protein HZB53_06110 [Chloroflexi bacterium]|nr:hypothetical protein [Chloroflexota bacterium]
MNPSAKLQALRDLLQRRPNAPATARHLAGALTGTNPGDHVLDELAAYVDDELAGVPVAQARPVVKQHLDRCESCSGLYLELLQAGLDELELPVQPAGAPKPDLSFLPSVPPLTYIAQQIAERILTRLAPGQLPRLGRLAGPFFRQLAGAGTLDLGHAYKATLSSEPVEAFQVLVFAYFTSQTLATELPAEHSSDWDGSVAMAADAVTQQMRIPLPVAQKLAQAYALDAAEWQSTLRKSR